MAHTARATSNGQWMVKKSGRTIAGSNSYVARNAKTGKFITTIHSDPKSTAIAEQLIEENLEMLKRLADR